MRVIVVSDEQGRIISISRPGDVGDAVSGIGAAGIVPEQRQSLNYIQLPEELAERPLLELHTEFRVDTRGDVARLVSAKEFVEPFRQEALDSEGKGRPKGG
jgi:hypothetical protein